MKDTESRRLGQDDGSNVSRFKDSEMTFRFATVIEPVFLWDRPRKVAPSESVDGK